MDGRAVNEAERRQQQHHPDQHHLRPYRSKRHRPCDTCRRRKHACYIENQPPCRTCRVLESQCTFNEPPSKRRRREHIDAPQTTSHVPLVSIPIDETEAEEGHVVADNSTVSWARTAELNPSDETVAVNFNDPNIFLDPMLPAIGNHDIWYATTMFETDMSTLLGDCSDYPGSNLSSRMPIRLPSPLSSNNALVDRGSRYQSTAQMHTHSTESVNTISQPEYLFSLDAAHETSPSAYTQYLGLSGEIDPYLLQHMRFSADGSCSFGQFQYLRAAIGSPGVVGEDTQIPAHFINTIHKRDAKDEASALAAKELDVLIPPEVGVRLIGLFLRYDFPNLPVLCRSGLKVRTQALIPSIKYLHSLPPYLLAAIYALSSSFGHYDPVVSVSRVGTDSPVAALWKMAQDGISRHASSSNMAVLQTMLIYLQKPEDEELMAATSSPGHWIMLGSAVNLAYRLGLHVDCRDWPIPNWEKRLRRRLWWVVYSEATWRSVLLGLPQQIQVDQWAVSPLEDSDYKIEDFNCPSEETAALAEVMHKPCTFCHTGRDFRLLTELAIIANEVYQAFYTLAAAKKLAADYVQSLFVGKRLLSRLTSWKDANPTRMNSEASSENESREYFHAGSSAHLKLAHLTVETLIYRALFRPLVQMTKSADAQQQNGDSSAEASSYRSNTPSRGMSNGNQVDTTKIGDLVRGGADLARRAILYAQGLGSYDRNSFIYSWSRGCFATISNFIMLMVIQAPNATFAKEALAILARWVITLREQCLLFEDMKLGLMRLDSIFRLGMEKAFQFPGHVRECLQNELPTPRYQK